MSKPKTNEEAIASTAADVFSAFQRQLVRDHLIPLAGAWYHMSGYVRAQMCIDADIPMTVARNEWHELGPQSRDKLHAAFMVWCDPKKGGKWT